MASTDKSIMLEFTQLTVQLASFLFYTMTFKGNLSPLVPTVDNLIQQRIEKSDLLQNPGWDSSLWIHFQHREPSGSPSVLLCFHRRTEDITGFRGFEEERCLFFYMYALYQNELFQEISHLILIQLK